jgi:hypothetical protein
VGVQHAFDTLAPPVAVKELHGLPNRIGVFRLRMHRLEYVVERYDEFEFQIFATPEVSPRLREFECEEVGAIEQPYGLNHLQSTHHGLNLIRLTLADLVKMPG